MDILRIVDPNAALLGRAADLARALADSPAGREARRMADLAEAVEAARTARVRFMRDDDDQGMPADQIWRGHDAADPTQLTQDEMIEAFWAD